MFCVESIWAQPVNNPTCPSSSACMARSESRVYISYPTHYIAVKTHENGLFPQVMCIYVLHCLVSQTKQIYGLRGWASRWRVHYQRGLPHLVCTIMTKHWVNVY